MSDTTTLITGLMALLSFTCFVKIVTVLGILRVGLGLRGISFSVVVIAVSILLSLFVMNPVFDQLGGVDGFLQQSENLEGGKFQTALRPFLEPNTDPFVLERFAAIENQIAGEEKTNPSFITLAVAFMITELQAAFQLGFLILLPFLVIDLLVMNVLMSLGVTQMSGSTIAIPLKLLLFVVVEGWTHLGERLLLSYAGGA